MSLINNPYTNFFDSISNEVTQMNKSLLSDPFFGSDNSDEKSIVKSSLGPDITKFDSFPNLIKPPVDIHDGEKSYTLNISVPGVSKDNVTIDYNNDLKELIIKGEFPNINEGSKIYSERVHGKFKRTLKLPTDIDGTKIKAKFENGILLLNVPKVKGAKNLHRIAIESSESWSDTEN